MKKEITIVTAYFDIGRKQFKNYERDNNKYIEYFKFWARIKNNIVVYTQPEFKEEIIKIRKNFGLENKTKVITIDNIYEIESEIYKKMVDIEKSKYFRNYKYINTTPENKADYNYIMFLKSWCLMETVKKKYNKTDFLAWLDFGFNHGGAVYTNPLEFDYLWEYDFEDKIYFFTPYGDNDKPIFHLVQSGEVCVSGTPYFVPAKLMGDYWNLMLSSMNSLLDVGLMDDDQTILLMAYRKNKDIFKLIKSDWFMPIKEYGGNHLTTIKSSQSKRQVNIINKLIYKYRVKKRNNKYLKRISTIFLKDYLD